MNGMKNIYQDYPQDEREVALSTDCNGSEVIEFTMPLSSHELDEKRKEFFENQKQLAALEKEKKAFLLKMKSKTAPLKQAQKEIEEVILKEGETFVERVYVFVDELGEASLYNKEGVFIKSRKAKPEEMQLNMVNNIKKFG